MISTKKSWREKVNQYFQKKFPFLFLYVTQKKMHKNDHSLILIYGISKISPFNCYATKLIFKNKKRKKNWVLQ